MIEEIINKMKGSLLEVGVLLVLSVIVLSKGVSEHELANLDSTKL